MVNQRLHYRRKCKYNTPKNKVKPVKAPSGKLMYQYVGKKTKGPRCGDCKQPLHGIPCVRPVAFSRVPRRKRTVTRAYGGSRCGKCVKNRILRAFLVEEQKCVRSVLAEKERMKKLADKTEKPQKKAGKGIKA